MCAPTPLRQGDSFYHRGSDEWTDPGWRPSQKIGTGGRRKCLVIPSIDPTAIVGNSVSYTDENGNFDLTGFESHDYILRADLYVFRARISNRVGEAAIPRISLPLVCTEFANSNLEVPSGSSGQQMGHGINLLQYGVLGNYETIGVSSKSTAF